METQTGIPSFPAGCPVIDQANRVLEHTKTLSKAVNKLRRDMRICDHCALRAECPVMRELNAQINAAIDALAADWGLE
jgi:hypothetical protein